MAPTAVPCEAHELPHVAIFPLMAKGHTIPLTHLAHLLLRRRLATVTFLTTPGNAVFVRAALSAGANDAAVVEVPFPDHVPGVPPGVESVEGLASVSSFAAFVEATSVLQPRFEEALAAVRPHVSLLVADAFLYWTAGAAAALGVPRVSFLGTSAFAHVIREACVRDKPGDASPPQCGAGDDAPGTYIVPEFPDVQFLLADLAPPPIPMLELDAKMAMAVAGSHGLIMNTFHELESRYVEHWNRHIGPRAWPVGPLCLSKQSSPVDQAHTKPSWLRWLDEKAAAGRAVLFVALGTLLWVPDAELKVLADGLDRARVDFLWAVKPENVNLGTGFEERVKGRGKVVREWVDQWEILRHDCVRGFLSHCGWNSVLECLSNGVPLVVWPRNFDQPLNAKLVADELGVGVRIRTSDGAVGGLVKSEDVTRAVQELMSGETGASAAKKAAAQARQAVSAGGSSWRAVEEMISELCVTTET